MAFVHGKNTRVWVDVADLSAFFSEVQVTEKADTAETTTFTASGKTYVAGLKDATASLKGLWDGAVGAVDAVLSSYLGNDTDKLWTIAPQGSGTIGNRAKLCAALQSEYQTSTPVNDVVSISGNVQADGGFDSGVLLAANTAITTTTNGTGVDNTASSTNGGVAHLHVTANNRNGNGTVKVQHSTDNVTYVDLATFATVTTSTTIADRQVVAAGTTVNRYLRYQDTLAGTTGGHTLTVAFARR